ncbi:MAG: PAS domain-containing sensor histidine kinase, partial [Acidobacteria bacterium]|nr:PAS domain-containing sensor histidine kinase [Acidobacteriota bacterium]
MRRRLSHEQRVLLLALAAGLPAVVLALVLLWTGEHPPRVEWSLTLLVLGCWLGLSLLLRRRVAYPLQTLANLLAALREGDYSLRGRFESADDALDQVVLEVNELSATLHQQRLDAVEATALLRNVIDEIDIAVFAFDADDRLQLVNRAGEELLAQPADRLAGRPAAEVGLAETLDGPPQRTMQKSFPGGLGRWGLRRSAFRLDGRQHQLVVLTDLSHALREEERQAWRRLIRVLGHEINNSLAPIRSTAGTLRTLLTREPPVEGREEDLLHGLGLIEDRSHSLSRFIAAYARLARLPPPSLRPISVAERVRRVAGLETRLPVIVEAGPPLALEADPDQLDQLLINLVRNAVDAALETGGGVRTGWRRKRRLLELWVEDDGPGLASS